jgi:hypothetical protein
MLRIRQSVGFILIMLGLGHASGPPQANLLPWAEGKPGCTFSADEDGKYRYGLRTDEFGIVIAVDADEVRKASLRVAPLFAIFVTVRYRGKESLSFVPTSASLEFASHTHAVQNAIDPDDFAAKLQNEADAFAEEMQRQISKHPEKKLEKESALRADTDTLKQTQEFLRSRSLRPIRLDSSSPETSGWIFFNAKSKWIGDWKKQEEFVLRIPLAGAVIEFPFALPPSQGDVLLRRR